MKNYLFILCFLCFCFQLQAQHDSISNNKYLEDQLYLSFSYNILIDKPNDLNQNGFSGGFSIGFIKDMPFTMQRDFGVGIGLGYTYNAFIQNLKITESVDQEILYEIASDFNKNRFSTSAIELPFEIRWRKSTIETYKFWRIYGGLKFIYLLNSKSIYSDAIETTKLKDISGFNRFQYGLTLAAGYNTWNLYIYYGLNSMLDNVELKGNSLFLRDFKVGLKFYMM
jgi:hypothetical protein